MQSTEIDSDRSLVRIEHLPFVPLHLRLTLVHRWRTENIEEEMGGVGFRGGGACGRSPDGNCSGSAAVNVVL